MDITKRISNSMTHKTEAKFSELPLDIQLIIISRLPVKLIMRCKYLSKALNKLISDPPFLQLYLTNNRYRPNFFYTLFVNDSKEFDICLDLFEFDLNEAFNNKECEGPICFLEIVSGMASDFVTRLPIFDLERLRGRAEEANDYNMMWGHCNGLLILRKLDTVSELYYHLFVINPIMGQSIQLPQPDAGHRDLLAYGIAFCQLTNRYKVLRIISNYYYAKPNYKYYSEIFTIGSDQNWRRLECYVPYDIDMKYSLQPPLVAFRSALHWIVRSDILLSEPNWAAGRTCICAFDMTEEKVSAIPMPPLVDASLLRLTVLLEKLSLWEGHGHDYNDVNIWVMDDYGVKCSWTKQFVFKLSTLASTYFSNHIPPFSLIPLTLLPGGVIVVSDGCQVMFYDMNKDKCLRIVREVEELSCLIPFVPSFVPLRDPFQG